VYYLVKEICVPWGGRGCRVPKVRWWDVGYLAMWHGESVLCRGECLMYDVMSSSGVVAGLCGTWCAAWDGFFCALPLCVQTA